MITAEQIAATIAGGGGEEPVDPTDPTDPTDPVDPTDPTDPVDPGEPGPGDTVTPGLGGDDQLTGTAGNDVLLAGAGDDVLSGLAGNDRLFGGTGNDTYIYHSGQDVITEEGGTDKVIFSNGITFNQVASGLMKSGNDLVLRVNGSSANSVTLTNFFLGGNHLVESFEFETGGSISAAQIFGAFGLAMPSGDAPSANVITGTAGDDILTGSTGDDVLNGSHGNDTLNGGAGNDLLKGGRGNDTYIFSAGGGQDIIDNTGGGEDELLFEGISFNQVASGLMKSGNDLVLNIGGGSDKVTIKNWFLGGDNVIPVLRFASGGQISANQIFGAFGLANPNPVQSLAYPSLPDEQAFASVYVGNTAAETIIGSSADDFIDGGDGNDVLRGGAGNDYLLGGRGNDIYLFGKADGHNIVNNYDPTAGRTDVLRFDGDVSPQDVSVERDGDNLILHTAADSSITVLNYFAEEGNSAYRLNQIEFADGTVWDLTTVVGLSADVASTTSTSKANEMLVLQSANLDSTDAFSHGSLIGTEPMAEPGSGTSAGYKRGGRYGQVQEFERVDRLYGETDISVVSAVSNVAGVKPAEEAVVSSQPANPNLLKWSLLNRDMPELAIHSKGARFGEVQEFERVERLHDEQGLTTTSASDESLNELVTLQATVGIVPEVAGSLILPTLEQSILAFSGEYKADRYAEVLELERVDRPHDALEAEVAKLIDAANAFDASDASELDGNISVVPEVAYHYY